MLTNLVGGEVVSAEELVEDLLAVCGKERLREYAESCAEGGSDTLDCYYAAVKARNGVGNVDEEWDEAMELIRERYLPEPEPEGSW